MRAEFECVETGVEMIKFNDIKQNQAETINSLEKELTHESIRKSGVNIELKRKLQTAVIKLDRGENDECLNEFCKLAYLSGWAVPKLPHNPDRRAAEEWVKMEVYMNSLEAQVEIANSARIYECNASRTCDAIFSNLEQAEYHRMTKTPIDELWVQSKFTRFWCIL